MINILIAKGFFCLLSHYPRIFWIFKSLSDVAMLGHIGAFSVAEIKRKKKFDHKALGTYLAYYILKRSYLLFLNQTVHLIPWK